MDRTQKWAESNQIQRSAHRQVAEALRKGSLERPSPSICGQCGTKTRLIAHHEDYDKPLDVEWLCYRCHWWGHEGETPPPRTRPAPALRVVRQRTREPRRRYRTEWVEVNPYICDGVSGGTPRHCRQPAESGKRFCWAHRFHKSDNKRPRRHDGMIRVRKEID